MNILLNIVTPAHNRPHLLARNLKSVHQQDGSERIQSIVVADSINTENFIAFSENRKTSDIFVLQEGIKGPAESRNIGIQMATAPYIMFLDDDDYLSPQCWTTIEIELKKSLLDQEAIQTNFILDYPKEEPQYRLVDISKIEWQQAFVKNHIPNCAIIFPTKVVKSLAFNSNIPYEDWDFLLAYLMKSKIRITNITGAVIHKDMSEGQTNRGRKNRSVDALIATYNHIYSTYQSPSEDIEAARHQLISQFGMTGKLVN